MSFIKLFLFLNTFVWIRSYSGYLYDFHLSAGKGSAESTIQSSSTEIVQYGFGGSALYDFNNIGLGFSIDYSMLEQLSDTSESYGNRRGNRINLLSPTIALKLSSFSFKLDYQWMGEYKLANTTRSGGSLLYEDPKGFRAYLGFLGKDWETGLFFESIEYTTETENDSQVTLESPLTVEQM